MRLLLLHRDQIHMHAHIPHIHAHARTHTDTITNTNQQAGQPCPLGSWYAHNIAQWGVREKNLGLVSLPLALVDPVVSCPVSTYMLRGGKRAGIGLDQAMELARGVSDAINKIETGSP